ncbi:MAG: tryptophan synthase subunit alpha [Clostridia bacterium]|nr:tryptophan synthase subunit alpha [Clostridia bacterium]
MSNIRKAFENGKACIPFITCGDPSLSATEKIIRAAAENGADLIELGIPFSDPTAEGPVIQASNIRALDKGVTTDKIFEMVRSLRRDVSVPMVFMTYANVIFSYGAERFISACEEIGIDGLLVPDLPFEEKEEFLPVCRDKGVALLSVIASNSSDRTAMIAKEAEGFICITAPEAGSCTGKELVSLIAEIRKHTDVPCAISAGITTAEQAAAMSALSDGVITDSEIIRIIEKQNADAPRFVAEYIRETKTSLSALE